MKHNSALSTLHSPLRILTVANVPPDPNSGAAGTVYYTNVALRELGHDVDEIWADDLGPRRIRHGNLHSLIEQPRRYVKAIRKAFSKADYDVVISQQPQSCMAARDHRRSGRKAIFLTMSQGVETRIWEVLSGFRTKLGIPPSSFPKSLLTEPLQRLLAKQWVYAVRYSDGIIVQHRQDKEFVMQRYGLPDGRVHISHSGLADEFLTRPIAEMTPQRRNRLLYVGQSSFYKGVNYLGRIVSAVLRRFPELTMTWVCNESDHLTALSYFDTDVRHRVQMVGWGSQSQLIDILDTHGIFVFPTLAEGFAKAPLEAMSRGMIVVASNCCGMRDYVPSSLGYLCRAGDAEDFVGTISELAIRPLSGSLPQRLHTHAMNYTWSATACRILEFVRSFNK
jgi:glycosyltransferase involved in cell wall biosynthesis